MIYVQIGASDGLSHGKPDGFFNYIKSKKITENDRILLVEPNPLLIPTLKENWKDYNVEIYECGIVSKSMLKEDLIFYWHEKNAPHHELSSFNPHHILKHHKELTINDLSKMKVEVIDLHSFIKENIGNEQIEMLAMDIEGIDAEILLDIDFQNFNVKNFSFEYIHLGDSYNKIISKLQSNQFNIVGKGLDPHGYDLMAINLK